MSHHERVLTRSTDRLFRIGAGRQTVCTQPPSRLKQRHDTQTARDRGAPHGSSNLYTTVGPLSTVQAAFKLALGPPTLPGSLSTRYPFNKSLFVPLSLLHTSKKLMISLLESSFLNKGCFPLVV